jgi:hypothetical protein
VMCQASEEGSRSRAHRIRRPSLQHHVRKERDWINQLAGDEAHISDAAAFHRMTDVSKMVHVVTDGSARSILVHPDGER